MSCQGCDAPLPPKKGPGPQRKWCSERCRKATLYGRDCVDCGKRVNTDGRATYPATRCDACARAHQYRITHEWIIASFREWHARFGRPPSTCDWQPTIAKYGRERKQAAIKATGRPWPSVNTVHKHFGSWNQALRANGFEPLDPSEYWIGRQGLQLREEDLAA